MSSRLFMCEAFAILLVPCSLPRHPLPVPSLPSLFIRLSLSPSPWSLLPSAIEQLAFHRPLPSQPHSIFHPALFFILFAPWTTLPPDPTALFTSLSLSLPRFISARCQFEFGTRATGQRVSTKNQFLNSRLFRAEGLAPGSTVLLQVSLSLFSLPGPPFATISSMKYRSNRLP